MCCIIYLIWLATVIAIYQICTGSAADFCLILYCWYHIMHIHILSVSLVNIVWNLLHEWPVTMSMLYIWIRLYLILHCRSFVTVIIVTMCPWVGWKTPWRSSWDTVCVTCPPCHQQTSCWHSSTVRTSHAASPWQVCVDDLLLLQ